ncbi:MAG: hypothetical protein Q8P18_06720 [Pseudomonadota bacterium]|nr:hypothetical protein [Pseudomonadota bacterium]
MSTIPTNVRRQHFEKVLLLPTAQAVHGAATMYHHVFRTPSRNLLFHTHGEAAELWRMLVVAFPELVALCLMPNHGHLQLPHDDPGGKLGRVLAGYARLRNARWGTRGPVFERTPRAEPIADRQKSATVQRYIELNPCRARIVDDPLTWPWSTARDAVGLAAIPARPRMEQAARHFAWLAADPTVRPSAELPRIRFADFGMDDILDGVCGLYRVPRAAAFVRGLPRTYTIRTAAAHGLGIAAIAAALGVDRGTATRAAAGTPSRAQNIADPVLAACVRVVGDPRFYALPEGDLRVGPGVSRLRPLGRWSETA